MAKADTLQDTFASGYDAAKWNYWDPLDFTFSGGQVTIKATANYSALDSFTTYDLTSSYAMVEMPSAGDVTRSGYISILMVYETLQLWDYNFQIGAGSQIIAALRNNSSAETVVATGTYNATNHRWRRIRESGGTVYWETSPDGRVWSTFYSQAAHFTPSIVSLRIGNGQFDAVSGSETSTTFDNFNVPPKAPLPFRRPTRFFNRRF